MKTLLREPLVHFIAVALIVFSTYSVWTEHLGRRGETITVTEQDMERMASLYAAESGALPSLEDMAAMVTDHVRDKALSREARRLGLDQDDTIIERRLAQKMSFMISDLADTTAPDEATLRAWYKAHPDAYTTAPNITFEHVFLSTDRRAATIEGDTTTLLATLNASTPPDWRTLGDPFMLQRAYGNLPFRETVRLFGADFARGLFALEPGDEWQGPVASSFGLHLVHLVSKDDGHLRTFEDVRAQVESDYRETAQRAANEKAVANIIKRYKVEIEGAE